MKDGNIHRFDYSPGQAPGRFFFALISYRFAVAAGELEGSRIRKNKYAGK